MDRGDRPGPAALDNSPIGSRYVRNLFHRARPESHRTQNVDCIAGANVDLRARMDATVSSTARVWGNRPPAIRTAARLGPMVPQNRLLLGGRFNLGVPRKSEDV